MKYKYFIFNKIINISEVSDKYREQIAIMVPRNYPVSSFYLITLAYTVLRHRPAENITKSSNK